MSSRVTTRCGGRWKGTTPWFPAPTAICWTWGWKSKHPEKGSGFSVSIGAILDDDVKTLGEGFRANEPPPAGETAVRYETKARVSYLIFFTRTF